MSNHHHLPLLMIYRLLLEFGKLVFHLIVNEVGQPIQRVALGLLGRVFILTFSTMQDEKDPLRKSYTASAKDEIKEIVFKNLDNEKGMTPTKHNVGKRSNLIISSDFGTRHLTIA